jgi:hypothetical protein
MNQPELSDHDRARIERCESYTPEESRVFKLLSIRSNELLRRVERAELDDGFNLALLGISASPLELNQAFADTFTNDALHQMARDILTDREEAGLNDDFCRNRIAGDESVFAIP